MTKWLNESQQNNENEAVSLDSLISKLCAVVSDGESEPVLSKKSQSSETYHGFFNQTENVLFLLSNGQPEVWRNWFSKPDIEYHGEDSLPNWQEFYKRSSINWIEDPEFVKEKQSE